MSKLNLTNCCFTHCLTMDPSNKNGSAIYTTLSYSSIYATSTVFATCSSSGYGGCIYSTGQEVIIKSCLFSGCQSDEKGSAIYHEKIDYSLNKIDQSLFTNNICKSSVVYSDTTNNDCDNSNFTRNQNIIHDQQLCCVYLFWSERSQVISFSHNNLIDNSGDFLIDLKLGDYNSNFHVEYVNMIDNTNLIFFLYLQEINPTNDPIISNFALFGNKPLSETDGVKMANLVSVSKMILTNFSRL